MSGDHFTAGLVKIVASDKAQLRRTMLGYFLSPLCQVLVQLVQRILHAKTRGRAVVFNNILWSWE